MQAPLSHSGSPFDPAKDPRSTALRKHCGSQGRNQRQRVTLASDLLHVVRRSAKTGLIEAVPCLQTELKVSDSVDFWMLSTVRWTHIATHLTSHFSSPQFTNPLTRCTLRYTDLHKSTLLNSPNMLKTMVFFNLNVLKELKTMYRMNKTWVFVEVLCFMMSPSKNPKPLQGTGKNGHTAATAYAPHPREQAA